MGKRYEVTIGIPVYQAVDYIHDALCSALNQTFPDIEFLIVDDCGNDGTMEMVLSIGQTHVRGKNIRIINNDRNYGVSYCRNRIIDEAKGKYLYFMDSDDTIEPDTIELLYDALICNHVQVAYGSYDIIDGIGKSPQKVYQKDSLVLKGEGELGLYAFKHNHVFHVSVCNHLIDLEFLRQSGVRFIEVSFWEDMAYTTELVTKVDSAVLLPDVTYHYYRRANSLSHYQVRDAYEIEEISKNIFVIQFLKEKCVSLIGKNYLPYLCLFLEMNSFYTICYIWKNHHLITQSVSLSEMRDILRHPLPMADILRFKNERVSNLCFSLLGNFPNPVFLLIIWLLGKFKGAL